MKLVFGTFVIIYVLNIIKISNGITRNPRLVCYYFNWGVYRAGLSRYTPQNINPYLCTHLIYAFASFTNNYRLTSSDKYQDIDNGGFEYFAKLKTYNPKLKLLIALGGSNEQSIHFSPLAADENLRKKFTKNAIRFLRRYKFDGIDLVWQYPGYREGSNSNDKENYVKLVKELRDEFANDAMLMNSGRYLITLSIPSDVKLVDKGFDIEKLNEYVDWFNLLSYDYHTSFEPFVNHHAPLYAVGNDKDLNIDYSVQSYLDAGADSKKIVVGIPTYGRSYTLQDINNNTFGAPSAGPGAESSTTKETGFLPYYEICLKLKNEPEWKVVETNATIVGPYAYNGDQWVGYDSENTAKIKANYITNNNLGGAVIWAINFDDFRGLCSNNGQPYQFIETIKEALFSNIKTITTTQVPPTTPNPGADFECLDIGLYPHSTNSSIYYMCIDSGPVQIGIIAQELICPNGMNFNATTKTCKTIISNSSLDSTAAEPSTTSMTEKLLSTSTELNFVITSKPIRLQRPQTKRISAKNLGLKLIKSTAPSTAVTKTAATDTTTSTESPNSEFNYNEKKELLNKIYSLQMVLAEFRKSMTLNAKEPPIQTPVQKSESLVPTLPTTTTTAAPIEEANDNIDNLNNYTIDNNEIIFSNMTNEQLKNDSFLSLLNQLSDKNDDDDDETSSFLKFLNNDYINQLFEFPSTSNAIQSREQEPMHKIETISIMKFSNDNDLLLSQNINKKIINKAIIPPKNGKRARIVISVEKIQNHKNILSKSL